MSILQAELARVKLAKTETRDRSAPKFQDEQEVAELANFTTLVLDINMEEWYGLLPDATFKTIFSPLSLDDAKLLVQAHIKWRETRDFSQVESSVNHIVLRLQQAIDTLKGDSGCVFAKSSCRSAKDTTVFDKRFRQLYREILQEADDPTNENNQLSSLLEAATEILKIRSAQELVEAFCTSERVFNDLSMALAEPTRFAQNFVIREWKPIKPHQEFRGFVKGGKLNALSQYNHPVHWPVLVEKQQDILSRINSFFYNEVEPKLREKFDDYVIDFALLGDDLEHPWVIELNPFLYTTDACLFSWMHERSILENGPFEFRLREQPCTGAKILLADEWRVVLEQETL